MSDWAVEEARQCRTARMLAGLLRREGIEVDEELQALLRVICEPAFPTDERAEELAARAADGDVEAGRTLVFECRRLAVLTARHHIGKGVPLDELIKAGERGLETALEGSFEREFLAYAPGCVRSAVNKAVIAHTSGAASDADAAAPAGEAPQMEQKGFLARLRELFK